MLASIHKSWAFLMNSTTLNWKSCAATIALMTIFGRSMSGAPAMVRSYTTPVGSQLVATASQWSFSSCASSPKVLLIATYAWLHRYTKRKECCQFS